MSIKQTTKQTNEQTNDKRFWYRVYILELCKTTVGNDSLIALFDTICCVKP